MDITGIGSDSNFLRTLFPFMNNSWACCLKVFFISEILKSGLKNFSSEFVVIIKDLILSKFIISKIISNSSKNCFCSDNTLSDLVWVIINIAVLSSSSYLKNFSEDEIIVNNNINNLSLILWIFIYSF